MSKVALIGLDGLSWQVVLAYRNEFRNVMKLASSGLRGINWCVPPYTPPSWTSISTGVHPLRHKILGFFRPSLDERGGIRYVLTKSNDVKYPRLSEMVAMNGLRSLVVNHVVSYPLWGWVLTNHVILGDMTSPERIAYPKAYAQYLDYLMYSNRVRMSKESDEWLIPLAEGLEKATEKLLYLVESVEHDFLWLMFKEPDTIMHYLQYVAAGMFNEKVARIFSIIDEFIGQIRKLHDYIIIVSDHGFSVYTDRINIYGVLRKQLPIADIRPNPMTKFFAIPISRYITWFLLSSTSKQGLWYKLRRYFSMFRNKTAKTDKSSSNNEVGDVISLDNIDGDDAYVVFVFKKELFGRVLNALENHKLIYRVYPFDLDGVKGILAVPKHGYHFLNNPSYSDELLHFAASRHSPAGLYVVNGKGIRPEVKHINNFDIAPTVLALMKLPLATHFDGKPVIYHENIGATNYLSKYKLLRRMGRIKYRLGK